MYTKQMLIYMQRSLNIHVHVHILYTQVIGERDEILQQLSEIQQQKQDIVGESQQMSLKYDNTQEEVHIS